MNKKIFTLFVGALLLLGSAFTASAQITESPETPYRFKGNFGVNTTDFYDVLRADTVKRLPSNHDDFFYLLSVTGIANPAGVGADFNTLAGNQPVPAVNGLKYAFTGNSLDSSWVMFPDKDGAVRIDKISMLDTAYTFQWPEKKDNPKQWSYKIGAIKQASWCVLINETSGVQGSNITFDFTNMANGNPLEAPLYTDNHFNKDGYLYDYDFSISNEAASDTNIVSGWHFSQSYVPTQNLQYGMPLYSYVTKDTVEVLVLADKDRYSDGFTARGPKGTGYGTPGVKIGGYYVTVAKVSVNDLIRDAQGNVRVTGDAGKYIKNVLLFTIKRLDRFVMNADDWNAGGREFLIGGNNASFSAAKSLGVLNATSYNNALDGVVATEVNDSLYHYGYMQFKNKDKGWLYVDTGFVNTGETEYLAFNYSAKRRDSTCLDVFKLNNDPTYIPTRVSNGMAWGESYKCGKPNAMDYIFDESYGLMGIGSGSFTWLNHDSIAVDTMMRNVLDELKRDLHVDTLTDPATGSRYLYLIGGTGSESVTFTAQSLVRNTLLSTASVTAPTGNWWIGGSLTFSNSITTPEGTRYCTTMPIDVYDYMYHESMAKNNKNKNCSMIEEFANPMEAYNAWIADSIDFLFEFYKDSLMENQSKFRVVYDPFADSAWINVYQTRVRNSNLADPKNPTYEPWWTNSFYYSVTGAPFAATGPLFFFPWYANAAAVAPAQAWGYTLYLRDQNRIYANASGSVGGGSTAYHGEGYGVAPGSYVNLARNSMHSFNASYLQSKISPMDRVMISTADTCALFVRRYTSLYTPGGQINGLSHIYGASKVAAPMPTYAYKDSLFYIDAQDLSSGKIMTLDQSVDNSGNNQSLDMQIKITYGDKCQVSENELKASIGNDLYLIRNKKGQYLCVPIWSIKDSLYWVTPEANEDPTKMPCYQWAVVNARNGVGSSPFRLVNREFNRIDFPYVYVYENQEAPFQFSKINPGFNTEKLYSKIGKPIGQVHEDVSAENFVTDMEARYPLSDSICFIPLDASVKGDQLLGYKYIDDDSTYASVYSFKYLHFMAQGNNAKYISWNGYEDKGDTGLYVNSETIYDKLFFDLQRLTGEELQGQQNQDYIKVTGSDNKGIDAAFEDIYKDYANKVHTFVNSDSLVLEAFGIRFNDEIIADSKIKDLKPLARQAYRLFLKDYYKWHPTLKGDYMTVGEQDRYILADRAYASKKYIKGSGRVEGLFGIPHYYFRNTYFDVNTSGDDYFAIVQRLDTARADVPDYEYQYKYYGATTMNDLYEYMVSQFGSIAAERVVRNVRENGEKSVAVAVVEDYTARLKFAMRGDAAIRVSTFQLEQDDDPIYRRFHVNEPADKEFFPEWGDRPDTLEFHWLNDGETGYRLYENSGNYFGTSEPVSDRFGEAGGRVYNIDNNNNFLRDSVHNVISFLGVNNSAQYGDVTNYAFFVDTAYINRGTGWIKPQYLIAVDPWKGKEDGSCDPSTGENTVGVNDHYELARYLFNASQYAKEVVDSVILDNDNRSVVYNGKFNNGVNGLSNKINNEDAGVDNNKNDFSGYYINPENFSKTEPIDESKVRRTPTYLWDGSIYTDAKTKWERLAFSWAIHKGDTLYVLKGLEPAYEGYINDPERVWQQLTKDYGTAGSNINFHLLKNFNIASTYKEAYFPFGDTKPFGKLQDFYTFKSMDEVKAAGKKIGLQAIILLNDNTHKDWVFSMRYVERNSSDFVIESETTDRDARYGAMIRPGYGGWVKYQNGIPTITRSDEKNLMGEAAGSIFNVKQLSNPVANEVVEGAAVVSNVKVIGGTGNVTILNATGKKVVVSNILGQTVANTVLSSDNASIAVPAGVVVVAVEGETAVKALVK